MENKSYLSNMR